VEKRDLSVFGFIASFLLLFCPSVRAQGTFASCGPNVNPIVCENSQTGNPSSEWDILGAGDSTIQGFATDISINLGQTIFFKINTPASSYHLDIYRMGYYSGSGARKVTTIGPSATLPQSQPACLTDATTGLIDCGNWAVSASWTAPTNAVSGIYFAKVIRNDTDGASHIVFIVRNDASRSDLLFQAADTTWQAYNNYGGNSLYEGGPAGRAYKVSYNRPFNDRNDSVPDQVFYAEYPTIRWLEANGYDVSYFTDTDADRRGSLLQRHKVFLSVGHDEYWSGNQRANVEAARGVGVHLAFFSGNEIFWKTRWENSIDGSNTQYRALVCYKETTDDAVIDPADPPTWTGTWRDPRFSPPADGGRPENALSGTIWVIQNRGDAITVPQNDGRMRFWRSTNIATLALGETATLSTNTLGYEWDQDADNGFRPAGLIRMSTTTVSTTGSDVLLDFGKTAGPGTATHHLTLYRHSSGALVFSAGTIQWSWGLDSNHDNPGTATDVRMQQAAVNLFADMGVQPGTLQAGLVSASASGDATPPVSTITAPALGASLPNSSVVTITGTAQDFGGGVVGGVEVSVNGGTTWHPATGRENWTYTWTTPSTLGAVTIKSRAVDDSGNLENPSTGVSVNVVARSCPCSIWSPVTTPLAVSWPNPTAVEVGVRFSADSNGYITGIRFYKGSLNTGTHIGNLWTSTGTLLASATFTNETASGWQQVNFSTPVAITGNTIYVASYHTDAGYYAADVYYFAHSGFDGAPLHALSNPNGVYETGATGFPNQSFDSSNYWVDVVFTQTANATGPVISNVTTSSVTTSSAVITSEVCMRRVKQFVVCFLAFALVAPNRGRPARGAGNIPFQFEEPLSG
jgi:hypothetical protein